MIHLDRVELLHWDIQQHQVLPLSKGVTVITGENGSGKTSVLDAIKVGLGARHPSAERKVTDYILKQARPVAMIRILVDNRREARTGRRPFDPLGAYGDDTITLAVVFTAVDENEYRRDHYIINGDVVPLGEGAPKPLPSAVEYRERLKKVGIGPRYLRLLRLPQGQVARLCAMNAKELFDYLFDIIGGRTVLENWETRLKELGECQREHDAVAASLKKARDDLSLLERRVARFRDYERYRGQAVACRVALPHRRLDEAEKLCRHLTEQLSAEQDALLGAKQVHADALEQSHRTAARQKELLAVEVGLKEQWGQAREHERLKIEETAETKARLSELERIKASAAGIAPEDPARLQREAEDRRSQMAAGDARIQQVKVELSGLEKELDAIGKGLLPLPAEVDDFRAALRQAGIPHHILAEVLEVSDTRWNRPIEGYLDRFRFAVLVQDPSSWSHAAELARKHRYSYGVLAPDIRGASPADAESLASVIEIKEARYRSLLARLLRRVVPGEPPRPLRPTKGRQEIVASDGFVVSRMEARHAPADRLYLGRAAMEARKRDIDARQQVLDGQILEWKEERSNLTTVIVDLEDRLALQQLRQNWESQQEAYAKTQEALARRQGDQALIRNEIASLEEKQQNCRDELTGIIGDLNVALERSGVAENRIQTIETALAELSGRLVPVQATVGDLKTRPLPELTDAAKEIIEQSSTEVIESMLRHYEESMAGFPVDERDAMLPLNCERQKAETDSVEGRLERLRAELDGIRDAAKSARDEYQQTTRRVFRAYFTHLKAAAEKIDFFVEGRLEQSDSERFQCDIKVGIGDKAPVHHDSQQLSGGQKAALSILLGMTAVSLEEDGAGFFLIDEPFSNSDLHKINELGRFLEQTGSQYLVSMPTTADLDKCGDWLLATWICTRSRGGIDENGKPVLAAPLKICFANGARVESHE